MQRPEPDPPTHPNPEVAKAIIWQADYATQNNAPVTSRTVRAQLALITGTTAVGQRLAAWPDTAMEDALPLRLNGALHNLHLTGRDDRLAPIYAGELTDQDAVDRVIGDVVADHDAVLLPWLDGPPQTNEAGRSGSVMAALQWLSGRVGPRFEMNELGASAGVNTMMDRFAFDLGGVRSGPADSPLCIAPEWRGPPPPGHPVVIEAIRGCDRAPLDLTDPAQALRLKSYVWPDTPVRMERLNAAIALARAKPPRVDRCDAGDWVAARLAAPQPIDTTRVVFHSIVWQYLPEATREAITADIEAAGALATASRRLAWIRLETNRTTFRHELNVRYWPGGEEEVVLGAAHAHGAWIEWFAIQQVSA
ncbi:DUF2332 domain-containing protein [Novosphingobium sp.]|uniref:DUF2332 domain-containing protein n=1 Tax=Novosphingobium sp. TaxID=1874826 RepID=UPI003B51CB13